MAVGNEERISRLMETAQRLRVVRAAQRRFLMLWAIDHPDDVADAARERRQQRNPMAEFLKRSPSRWSN
jgi:hypothetical protein